MPRPKCAVEFCQNKSSTTNEYGMCFNHGEQLKFLLWAIPKIALQKEQKQPALWTPNSGIPSGILQQVKQ